MIWIDNTYIVSLRPASAASPQKVPRRCGHLKLCAGGLEQDRQSTTKWWWVMMSFTIKQFRCYKKKDSTLPSVEIYMDSAWFTWIWWILPNLIHQKPGFMVDHDGKRRHVSSQNMRKTAVGEPLFTSFARRKGGWIKGIYCLRLLDPYPHGFWILLSSKELTMKSKQPGNGKTPYSIIGKSDQIAACNGMFNGFSECPFFFSVCAKLPHMSFPSLLP